jgi:hypothetical protein
MRKARPESPIEGNYRDWPDIAAYRRDARQAHLLLRLLRSPGRPAGGLCLFSAIRNEVARLPGFVKHYRELGVARFVVVDNDSSDGTREWLLDQPDVELYHTAASYAAANGGTLWIDGLISELTENAWVVFADADELLVYDRCDQYSLPALAERLQALGERNLLAPLLDLYPDSKHPGELLFDAAPEPSRKTGRGLFVEGGPRYRMAVTLGHAQFPCLTKYPFARYGPRTAFANAHFPYPARANGYRIRARLLHLKIDSQFRAKVAEALRDGQHWNDGAEYRSYAEWLDEHDAADLATGISRRYTGPADLIAAGLLEPLEWQRSNASLRLGNALRRVWYRRRH